MRSSAKVQSVEAIKEWKSEFNFFIQETQNILQSADVSIHYSEEWIKDRSRFWSREVDKCRNDVREAQRDFEECKNSREDDDFDCSSEIETLKSAKYHLHKSESELENVIRWKRQFEGKVASYRNRDRRLKYWLERDAPKASAFLGKAINALINYIEVISISEKIDTDLMMQSIGSDNQDQLNDALKSLLDSKEGQEIANEILKRGIHIKFVVLRDVYKKMPDGSSKLEKITYGNYDHPSTTIELNIKHLKNASKIVLAAHISHEGIHMHDSFKGKESNSIEEEFNAFKKQIKYWCENRGTDVDPFLDYLDKINRSGDGELRWSIVNWYPNLPMNS